MEFRKIVTITLYVRQQENHRCIAQSFGLCGRGQGWDDLGEGHCILSYVKQIASPGSMHGTVCSGHVHWDDPEGWDGKGGGGGLRMQNTCTSMADSCQCMAKTLQYCKVISSQLK